MKIIVFGASGQTGRELVGQGRALGYTVTAFVRDASKIPAMDGIEVVQGDVREPTSVTDAMAGHSAVLVALGSGTLGRSDLLKCGGINIIAAMHQHGVHRIIALGAAGSIPGATKNQGLVGRIFFSALTGTLLRNVLADQRELEHEIAASDLNYTIVRPAGLTNGPATGTYRASVDALPAKWRPIPRSEVATFMLDQLNNPAPASNAIYISR